MPEWISTLGVALGSAWLSGINLYATVATLGLLQRLHVASLPGQMQVLENPWIIGIAAAMYAVEFVSDKIPIVDTAWDMVHTFVRVPAGAALAFATFADADPSVRVIAMLVGGGVALGSHGAKAATRAAVNTSPEPVSNIALSLIEDVFTIGSNVLLPWFPVIVLIVVIVFTAVTIWLAPKVFRAMRNLFSRPLAKTSALTENR